MRMKNNKRKVHSIRISSLLILFAAMIICLIPKTARAAENSVSVKEINYSDSTITLQVYNDTEVYFSDSTQKSWEKVPGDITNNTITMDISWVSDTKNYVMTFKGNSSTNILSVTIPKQVTNFKATYNKVKGNVSFNNSGTRIIQWRKKGSTVWNIVNMDTLAKEMSYLCTNGAVIYFRLAPENGSSAVSTGARASKEVSVTIPKRTDAPNIIIDGSRFCIAVKKGMAYRTVNSNNTTSDWTTINYTTNMLLKELAPAAMYSGADTTQSVVTLQFRTNATSASQVSKIRTVTVPIQEKAPSADTYGISLSYISSSAVSLQVKAASSTIPFEYTVIEDGDTLDYQTATWFSITSSTAVTLSEEAAPEGSHIYVRKKSIAATAVLNFTLASVEMDISGTSGVKYPDAPETTVLTTLISTAGVCKTTDSSTYLTFNLYSPTSTTVASISFLDAYGITKGTVSCKSTVTKNANSTGTDDKYLITTKITSTASIDAVTEELLYARITLANADVIISSDTSGVQLYLYPQTVVNNPSDDSEYTNQFNRVYLSNDANDDGNFKFRLDFGTQYIANTSAVDRYTSEAVAISSIKYEDYTLTSGSDYTVSYGTYINDENETIATATITVNVNNFETNALIDTTDLALPLIIQLNNGEVLNEDVTIKLINTATLSNTPIAWSITEGSLKETKTSTVTNSDNTTTTVTEEVITYTLVLTLYDKNYGVSVSDVSWGGTSIFGSAKISSGTATIYLSNAKINKLMTNSTDTKNIIITLSNGFAIKSGCKLTILNAS